MEPVVYLITGPMAAGKTTVARLLAARFPRGVHLEGDLFRRSIVSGRDEVTPDLRPGAVEQLRLLVLKTAWLMDTVGNRGAHAEIQAIKIATPRAVVDIIDRAIQLHGAGGVSQDFPLAELYAGARTLMIADGPDEVHQRSLARRELKKYL